MALAEKLSAPRLYLTTYSTSLHQPTLQHFAQRGSSVQISNFKVDVDSKSFQSVAVYLLCSEPGSHETSTAPLHVKMSFRAHTRENDLNKVTCCRFNSKNSRWSATSLRRQEGRHFVHTYRHNESQKKHSTSGHIVPWKRWYTKIYTMSLWPSSMWLDVVLFTPQRSLRFQNAHSKLIVSHIKTHTHTGRCFDVTLWPVVHCM